MYHSPPRSVNLKIPESLVLKVQRSWDAPIEQRVAEGVLPSGNVVSRKTIGSALAIRQKGVAFLSRLVDFAVRDEQKTAYARLFVL